MKTTFLSSILNLKKCKELKRGLNKELMPVAWHSKRWWDWWVTEDEKKEIDSMYIKEL